MRTKGRKDRPRRLTLRKETLRQLTATELRLVAGGAAAPRSNAWTTRGGIETVCGS